MLPMAMFHRWLRGLWVPFCGTWDPDVNTKNATCSTWNHGMLRHPRSRQDSGSPSKANPDKIKGFCVRATSSRRGFRKRPSPMTSLRVTEAEIPTTFCTRTKRHVPWTGQVDRTN